MSEVVGQSVNAESRTVETNRRTGFAHEVLRHYAYDTRRVDANQAFRTSFFVERTVQTKPFESLKFGMTLSIPTDRDHLDEDYEAAAQWCMLRMVEALNKLAPKVLGNDPKAIAF